jgi:predicted Zn-dependent protease
MKRRWKSLFLALNWLFLSFGTSILIILTHPLVSTANEPASTTETKPKPSEDPKAPTTETKPKPSEEPKKPDEKASEPVPSPEELARQKKLIEADKLYLEGKIAEAEKLYREVKEPFANTTEKKELKEAILDPEQLSPAGRVYWREAQAGIANKLQSRILIPLQLLTQQIPEFIPGHITYAQYLRQYGRKKEALQVLEQAATVYPNQPDLVKARVEELAFAEKWMEASIAARQFAMLNSTSPQAAEFTKLAEVNLERFKGNMRDEVRGNTIANIITGAIGYAVTGSLLGPFTALDSTIMLLRGEGAIGESVAIEAKKQLEVVEDETITGYINEIGQKLVKIAGREEFKYDFFVIPFEDLNAFALPGGKIFLNAGAIAKTNSEAEIAGLIGHELSHVVLSHGFQIVSQGNLVGNLTQYLPFGGTIGQLFSLSYSRDMERQADILGTRLLTAGGYAADGLRNLMKTLEKEQKQKFAPPSWLASHPGGSERVSYLENLISESRYNRYAYEGVARHNEIKAKVKQLLKERKEKKENEQKKPRSS